MGPLEQGIMEFDIIANPPDFRKIPTKEDLLGISAIILSCYYK